MIVDESSPGMPDDVVAAVPDDVRLFRKPENNVDSEVVYDVIGFKQA